MDDTRPNPVVAEVPAELEAAADGYAPYDEAGALPYAPPEPEIAPAAEAAEPEPEPYEEPDADFEPENAAYEEASYDEIAYEEEIGWPDDPYADDMAVDDAYDDEADVDLPSGDDNAARAAGLLRPILDLTHIDERNRPHLVWTESPGADRYAVEEDDQPGFASAKVYRVRGGDTRWSPQGLLWRRSGRLYYRVRAENDRYAGPWSDVLQVRIGRG